MIKFKCVAQGCAKDARSSTPIGRLCGTHTSRYYRKGILEIDNPRPRLSEPPAGASFGHWTVVGSMASRVHKDGTTRLVECCCVCGIRKPVELRSLLNGTSTSCGCSRPSASHQERFWRNVKRGNDDECWPYGTSSHYGKVRLGGRSAPQMAAHRYSYMISFGHVPPIDLVVMHKCDNPKCVNPKHLMLGTPADNAADMVSKGRWRGGFKPGFDPRRRRKQHV